MGLKSALLYLLLAVQVALNCHAQSLETPTGPVILTISGEIEPANNPGDEQENTDVNKTVQFDLAMLEKIGLTRIVTETPWTEGLVNFEGVLFKDLLALINARGSSIRASALDNYSIDIPIEDFLNHDVILATRIDGKALRVRDNGPLWVIYPWTDNSALKRPIYFSRSIWQLHSFTVNK